MPHVMDRAQPGTQTRPEIREVASTSKVERVGNKASLGHDRSMEPPVVKAEVSEPSGLAIFHLSANTPASPLPELTAQHDAQLPAGPSSGSYTPQQEHSASSTPGPRGMKRKITSPTPSNGSLPDRRGDLDGLENNGTPIKEERYDVRGGPSAQSGPDSNTAVARMGTKAPGSADKVGTGEECFHWTEIPMNKQGFRYIPCAPSPSLSPTSSYPFYRSIPAPPLSHPVHLDWLDRSAYLKLSETALSCTTEKGFRSVRGNVGVKEGNWYFECVIEHGGGGDGSRIKGRTIGEATAGASSPMAETARRVAGSTEGPHVRLGWARREASLNGPCGLDGYSYGVRDVTGEKVHLSRPRAYGQPFGTGDIVGCLISLPPRPVPRDDDPQDPARVRRKRVAIRYKGQLYFETVDYTVSKEMEDLVGRDNKSSATTTTTLADGNDGGEPLQNGEGSNSAPGKPNGNGGGKPGKGIKKGRRKDVASSVAAKENQVPVARPLARLAGSSISFFLNGQPMAPEPAFIDVFSFLPLRRQHEKSKGGQKKAHNAEAANKDRENHFDDGTLGYYPLISVFGNAKVRFNAGPEWEAPVDPGQWGLGLQVDQDGSDRHVVPRPLCERWDEFRVEERVYDDIDEAEFVERWKKEIKAEEARARNGRSKAEVVAAGSAGGSRASKGKATKSGLNVTRKNSKLSVAAIANSQERAGAFGYERSALTPDIPDRTTPSARSTPAPSSLAVQGGYSPGPSERDASVPPPQRLHLANGSRKLSESAESPGDASTKQSSPVQEIDPLAGWDPEVLASMSRSQLRALKGDLGRPRSTPAKKESSPAGMTVATAPEVAESDTLPVNDSRSTAREEFTATNDAEADAVMTDVKPAVADLEQADALREFPDAPMMASEVAMDEDEDEDEDAEGEDDDDL